MPEPLGQYPSGAPYPTGNAATTSCALNRKVCFILRGIFPSESALSSTISRGPRLPTPHKPTFVSVAGTPGHGLCVARESPFPGLTRGSRYIHDTRGVPGHMGRLRAPLPAHTRTWGSHSGVRPVPSHGDHPPSSLTGGTWGARAPGPGHCTWALSSEGAPTPGSQRLPDPQPSWGSEAPRCPSVMGKDSSVHPGPARGTELSEVKGQPQGPQRQWVLMEGGGGGQGGGSLCPPGSRLVEGGRSGKLQPLEETRCFPTTDAPAPPHSHGRPNSGPPKGHGTPGA